MSLSTKDNSGGLKASFSLIEGFTVYDILELYRCTCTVAGYIYTNVRECLIYRRRTVAKNKRESRRATQPLPADLLERISKHDQMEEQKTEQVTPTSATPTSATPTSATPSKLTSTNSADISVTAPTPPLPTTPTPPLTTPTTIQPTTPNVSQMATPTGNVSIKILSGFLNCGEC